LPTNRFRPRQIETLNTLLGISVSTLRGLMYGAFKGTFLNNALLPLVDIAQIQPERAPE
jgi:formate-dependent nitrite reductase membrane component NrfD